MGKTIPLVEIQILDYFMALTWPKRTQSAPKFVALFPPLAIQLWTRNSPTVERWKQHKNAQEWSQPLNVNKNTSQPWEKWRTQQRTWMVNVRSSKIVGKTKNVNDFTHRKVKILERAHVKEEWWWKHTNMKAWYNGLHFWVSAFPRSQNAFPKNYWLLQFEFGLSCLAHPMQ